MIKIMCLLLGISLKQTVDEFKNLIERRASSLEKRRDNLAEYKPLIGLERGTMEAAIAEEQNRHRVRIAPQVEKLNKNIRWLRLVPLCGYISLTAILFLSIMILESHGNSE
jgi:hypothetical protein